MQTSKKDELRQLFVDKIHAEQMSPTAGRARQLYVEGAVVEGAGSPTRPRKPSVRAPVRAVKASDTERLRIQREIEDVERWLEQHAEAKTWLDQHHPDMDSADRSACCRGWVPRSSVLCDVDEKRVTRMQAMRAGGKPEIEALTTQDEAQYQRMLAARQGRPDQPQGGADDERFKRMQAIRPERAPGFTRHLLPFGFMGGPKPNDEE